MRDTNARVLGAIRRHRAPFLQYVLSPVAASIVIDFVLTNGPFIYFIPVNAAFCLLTMAVLWFATGSIRFSGIGLVAFHFVVDVGSHYVKRFRGRGILLTDLFSFRTALNVAEGQDWSIDSDIIASIILFIVSVMFIMSRWSLWPKVRFRGRLAALAMSFLLFCVTTFFPVRTRGNLYDSTGLGTHLDFVLCLPMLKLDEPDGYDRGEVDAMLASYGDKEGGVPLMPENIILVMDESFTDYSIYPGWDDFDWPVDPYENVHAIMWSDNVMSGYVCSPVRGGSTSSVEYELLTGLSAYFLPKDCSPYMLYVNDGLPSLARSASAAGYHTVAYHPHVSTGYDRQSAYARLGFDEQLYAYADMAEFRENGIVSDVDDFRTLFRLTDETEGRLFIHNVTIQNHSGQTRLMDNPAYDVDVPDDLASLYVGIQYYLDLFYRTDRALPELLEHYADSDERTLVLFFGDHHPYLPDLVYERLSGKAVSEWDPGDALLEQKTPFFVWANYDIPSEKDLEISASCLYSVVMRLCGLPGTGYSSWLSEFQAGVPVLTQYVVRTGDGTVFPDDVPEGLLSEYEKVNYRALRDTDSSSSVFQAPAE